MRRKPYRRFWEGMGSVYGQFVPTESLLLKCAGLEAAAFPVLYPRPDYVDSRLNKKQYSVKKSFLRKVRTGRSLEPREDQ